MLVSKPFKQESTRLEESNETLHERKSSNEDLTSVMQPKILNKGVKNLAQTSLLTD